MANQYPPPYNNGYGLPFQFPPPQQMQQPAPNAPSDAQGGQHPQMQHAPPPHAFHIPGLSNASSPRANQLSFGQNSQQPPFPAAAWPPQDANSAWFASVQHAFANGGPPPPLPGFGLPFPPQMPQFPTTPMAFPPQPVQHQPSQPTPAARERIQEVMDSEKEDGELSEGEVVPLPRAVKANGQAYQEPPRSVPQSKPVPAPVEEEYNPNQPAAGQRTVKEPLRKASKTMAPKSPVDALQENRDQAKQFVKLLHSHNIGYRALAKEPLDLDQLRGLYQSLNLPSEPAPILPPKPSTATPKTTAQASDSMAVQPASIEQTEQQKPTPTVKTNVAAITTAKAAPSPVDRRDYIARLQAAKLAKSGAAKTSPPQQTPPVAAPPPPPPVLAVKSPPAVSTPTAKPPVTDEQRARNTELIKQRLEAIKLKNALNAASNSTATVSSPTQQVAEQAVTSGVTTPQNQAYKSPFPGIPGLFMNPPPSYNSNAPHPMPLALPKRPPPVVYTETSTPAGSVTPYARPSADSPHADQDESMLMEVGDDESNGSDMDIDDDQAPERSALAFPPPTQQQQRPEEVPAAVPAASSAASTPGPPTPATQAREQELRSKEDQLAAMRLTLKRKLAEKREKDKAAAAAAAAASASSSLQNGTSAPQPIAQMPSLPESRPFESAIASSEAMEEASELIRDVKRRRREEIQSKLPSFDAELAVNTDRMAQLMKEMELLKAQNERIAGDKERLTSELEGLGVDTEGMSHAEMLAKKDEIENEDVAEPQDGANAVSEPATTALDETSTHPTAVAQDAVEVQEALEVEALPAEDEASNEQADLPGLAHSPEHVFEQVTAPSQASQASTVDEVQTSQTAPVASDLQPPITQTQSQLEELPTTTAPPPAQDTVAALDTPLDEEDDFYSPAPADAPALDESMDLDDSIQAQMAADASANSPSEEGEVEMSLASEDEEEEYDPEEPVIIDDTPIQDAQGPEVEMAKSPASEDISTEDEEAYEPPDVNEEILDDRVDETVVAAEVAVPEVEAEVEVEAEADEEDGAMDIASSSEDSDSDSDAESLPDDQLNFGDGETISANHGASELTNVADDLAQKLQPESASEAVLTDDEPEVPRFTAYESPLRMFKSYRYHPNFAQDVSGGFLSPTYSHQIDAEKPFCQYETAGGSCNDPECSNQHFRGMSITGEALLVQLGTANPGKTAEEKQRWNDGLRGVLKELRKKSIKDPNGIAVEIAKYRREFLKDDTRVVNL